MKRKTREKNVKLKLIYVTIKYRNQEDCKNTGMKSVDVVMTNQYS